LEGAHKKALELETKNSNYQNEVSELHNRLAKINKTLGLINSKWAAL
jgi:wobble nucleotide-excising tRNase